MGSIADIHFTAALDDARLQVDAKKAGSKAGQSLGSSLAASVKKSWGGAELGKGLVQGLGLAGGLGAANALAGGIGKLTDFIGESVEAASNLNEETSKSEVIFGDNARAIQDWAATGAVAFGQSKRAALQAASGFAGLFSTVGTGIDEATERAKKLTELGADLASFFNTDVQTALDALKSGLSGESEPLRAFNVFLSETAVTAKLTQMGVQKVDGAFTEAQKATARYALILEQTSVAQGDYARTADGLANSQRSADAALENAQANLGQKFLPIAKQVTEWQIDAIEGGERVVHGIEFIAGAFTGAEPSLQDYRDALVKIEAQHGLMGRDEGAIAQVTEKIRYLEEQAKAVADGKLFDKIAADMQAAANKASTAAADAVAAIPPAFSGVAKVVSSSIGNMGADWSKVAKAQANRLGSSIAAGINEKRSEVDQAWDFLLLGLKNAMTPTQERAKLLGYLTSAELIKGLRSGDPAVKAQAQATKQVILDRLTELGANAKNIGKKGMDELKQGMKSRDPDIRAASLAIYNASTSKVKTLPPAMKTYGAAAGKAYAAGLRSTYGLVNDAANYVARGATGAFEASSPPGPDSPLHLIDVWGAKTIQAWADGLRSKGREALKATQDVAAMAAGGFGMGLPSLAHAVPNMSGAASPGFSAVAPAPVASGGTTINNIANVQGLVKAKTGLEIAWQLSRFGTTGDTADVRSDDPR